MSNGLFYTIPLGFCVGLFFASLFPIPREVVFLLLMLSFTCALFWRRSGAASPFLLIGSLFLVCAAIGLLRCELTLWRESSLAHVRGQEVTLQGVVVREPDMRATVQHLYIREDSSKELFLATTDTFIPISYGDHVIVSGIVEKPESFETDLGRTFDYAGYLKAQGVSHALFFADVSVVGNGKGNPIIAFLLAAKHQFMARLEEVLPEPQAGLAEGLLLGVKRALGEDLTHTFRTAGIIHIVVLSGYNLMIVADALMRVLSFFFRPFLRMIFGIMAIVLFALVVGLSATVIRASVMASLLLYARATGHNGHALRALCVAGILMLLINPHLLVFDPGFQLSFLATLGLVLVSPAIEKLLHFAPTSFQIREFLIATVATQIMVLPLLLYAIGEFSVVAVFANILVLPMVPVAMFLAFLTGVLGFVSLPVAILVGFLANVSLAYIIVTATLFAVFPFASFIVPSFPFWVGIVLYVLLAFVLWRAHRPDTIREESSESDDLADWKLVSLETVTVETNKPDETQGVSSGLFPFR